MNEQMDELKGLWKEAKTELNSVSAGADQLIMKAEREKKINLYEHLTKIVILTVTLVGISLFFYYVAPFKTVFSRIGMGLMIGSLLFRIVVEVVSSMKSLKIDLGKDALNATEDVLNFYNYRQKIHGSFTFVILALYTIGFYMLTPEFSMHLDAQRMVLIHASYIVGAVFVGWQIRNGIRREMKNLQEMISLKREIAKGE